MKSKVVTIFRAEKITVTICNINGVKIAVSISAAFFITLSVSAEKEEVIYSEPIIDR